MRTTPLILALASALAGPAHAQVAGTPATVEAPADAGHVLGTAVVRAPGPGMWKVTRGDHVMWVLGTVSPLPAGMEWNSARMRSVVKQADAVIAGPMVSVGADVGFFGKLALLPSIVGVQDLPDGQHLRDVLPPATYARWTRLKSRYLGNDNGVEEMRPIFAGNKLYEAALKQHRLSSRGVVGPQLAEALKARGLKQVQPTAKLTIAKPKAVIKEFKRTNLADVRCFETVLERVENDIDTLAARADAWSKGDVATLRALQRGEPASTCEDALLSGAFAQKYGMDRLQAQAEAKWIAEVESSLAAHRTTFTALPMREILTPGGLVPRLASKGYTVEAPDAVAPAAATTAPVASPAPASR